MKPNRLEAFSDGVLAIVITIMVLTLQVPTGDATASFSSLLSADLLPAVASYVLSFVYVAIYWNNHHHLLTTVQTVTAGVMWANMHLLFWLSLVPFATAWMGRNAGAAAPAALYGMVLLACAVAYYILGRTIIGASGPASTLAQAVGWDRKNVVSVLLYLAGIVIAFAWVPASYALFAAVAVLWIIPDRRIQPTMDGRT